MIVMKLALPRRTFLCGTAVTIGLPLLDAMVPAFTAQAKTAAAPTPRLGFIYTPNGYVRSSWVPAKSGSEFDLPGSLSALEPWRDSLVVVSGLAQLQASAMNEPPGPHSRACGAWLTGVHVKRTEGADVRAAKSADQLAADVLGRTTPLPSLELAIEPNEKSIGNCEVGYTCIYQNTVSWRDATTPLPVETHPRVVFERLFGDGGTPEAERAELRLNRSILDSVNARIADLRKLLGPGDRHRIDQYLDSLRDIESRIARAEARTAELAVSLPERPIDIPAEFEDHVKMMFDLQVLAYQGDIMRIQTLMLSREQSPRAYPNLGVVEGHHAISHHGENPEKVAQKAKIDGYHAKLLTYYIEKLKSTPDGDGSLLDHVAVLYGCGFGDSNNHAPLDLPNIIVGRAGGKLKTGRHLAFDVQAHVPQANLLISLLDLAGVPIEKFGDGTGKLEGLAGL